MYTDTQLIDLIHRGESDRVEFTVSVSKLDKVREAICAFANDLPNHKEPGFVFIGIKDNGDCAGISIDDRLLLTFSQLRDDGKILPFPNIEVAKKELNGCELVVIQVEPSDNPPIKVDGRCWIRIGSRRSQASREEERRLTEKRLRKNLAFDMQGVGGASVEHDLDMEKFEHEYLPAAVSPEVLEENDRNRKEQLQALRLTTPEGTPTVTALLMLGKEPRRWFPGAYIQFARFDGGDCTDPILDQEEIRGTLTEQLIALDKILRMNIATALDASGTRHRQEPDYPFAALRELVRNAVIHRNYHGSNAPVRVYWFSDRIEIISPGSVYGEVTPENFGKPGSTDYRNPTITEAMKNMGFMQQFGMGILKAQKALHSNGNPEAIFDIEDTFVAATVKKEVKKRGQETTMKTIALFNNKGGVGKTSLVYHLAWMFKELEYRVIAADLDPQANLSSMFLEEQRLEELINGSDGRTINQELDLLFEGIDDIRSRPYVETIDDGIGLLVGDLSLSKREDELSAQWVQCLSGDNKRAFRVTTAFSRLIQNAAQSFKADIVLIDVGPNLGTVNRAALIASDYIVLPLAPDLFSLQGLQNVGPTLKIWRESWRQRREKEPPKLEIELPARQMEPKGYIIMRHSVRIDRPVKAYDRWIEKIPRTYQQHVLGNSGAPASDDEIISQHCLAHLKDYRSLMPLAQEARKPMFMLKPADGAIGAHQSAVLECYKHFKELAEKIIAACDIPSPD